MCVVRSAVVVLWGKCRVSVAARMRVRLQQCRWPLLLFHSLLESFTTDGRATAIVPIDQSSSVMDAHYSTATWSVVLARARNVGTVHVYGHVYRCPWLQLNGFRW
jgi:hypothetical protein